MIESEPLPPPGGYFRKGVIYRVPSPRTPPPRPLDPDMLAFLQRRRQQIIREYLERRQSKQ